MEPLVHTERLEAGTFDPARLLDAPLRPLGRRSRRHRFYFAAPDGGPTVVGLGLAAGVGGTMMWGLGGRRDAGAGYGALLSRLPGARDGLPAIVTAAFDPTGATAGSELWTGFDNTSGLHVPRVMLWVEGAVATLSIVGNTAPDPDATARELAREAAELRRWLLHPTARPAGASQPPLRQRPVPALLSPAETDVARRRVEAALSAIERGEVEKVVVAIAHQAALRRPLDAATVLARLRAAQPGCFHYLVQFRPYRAFVGASPERLVAVDGSRVRTMALAGSAPRAADPEEDRRLGEALLASAKDRAEHALVVAAIKDTLTPLTTSLDVPARPRLKRLATIQHLETPITATLPAQGDLVDLAARLHPTPALAGTPREAALALIRRLEGGERGWYGGLVGWADHQGNGDLAVAIRCLLLAGNTATAFAGAGIVAGSDPEREVAEIALKLGAALGGVAAPNPGRAAPNPGRAPS
jgi:isochorismate synthase